MFNPSYIRFNIRLCQCPSESREDLDVLDSTVAGQIHGGEVCIAEMPSADTGEHPWRRIAGMFADDADFDEWQAEIQSYRREQDQEETTW